MFGRGKGPVWLDNLRCVGNESRLQDCPHNSYAVQNCNHGEDAGVYCSGKIFYAFDNRIFYFRNKAEQLIVTMSTMVYKYLLQKATMIVTRKTFLFLSLPPSQFERLVI